MDQDAVAFARSWARRYVRTKHPHGLDEEDVENRILEFLHYNKDKRRALSKALNSIQDEGRRNLRALCPWQVRNAEPCLETQSYRSLSRDMHRMRIRQRIRENDRRRVCQIDLLVQTPRTAYVVEIKRQKEIGPEIEDEVRRKISRIPLRSGMTPRPVLVYDGTLAPSVEGTGFFDAVIPAHKLLGI